MLRLTDGQAFPTTYPKHTRAFLESFIGEEVTIEVSPKEFLYSIAKCEARGEVLSWAGLLKREGVDKLRGGMHPFDTRDYSVLLMKTGPDAKFPNEVQDNGRTLIFCGQRRSVLHEAVPDNNAWFERQVRAYRDQRKPARAVRVYERIEEGPWVYYGLFSLVDCWHEANGDLRFKLVVKEPAKASATGPSLVWTREIPTAVKLEVWARDEGKCRLCHSDKNLQFDHVIPFAKGGSSLTAANIQVLCIECNRRKSDSIQ